MKQVETHFYKMRRAYGSSKIFITRGVASINFVATDFNPLRFASKKQSHKKSPSKKRGFVLKRRFNYLSSGLPDLRASLSAPSICSFN